MAYASLVFATWLATAASTNVFVMLDLNTFKSDGSLQDKAGLSSQLDKLKEANVDGFMVDLWWGITEPKPKEYNFASTKELLQMAKARGMTVQLVSSFHRCGGNVGDTCDIPLPSFVLSQKDIWYTDANGGTDTEYISLFADNVSVAGRTPVQMYGDWFKALFEALAEDLDTVAEIQVGMGPAGELRYPSYQGDKWQFCGVGAFQCFDTHALASFKAAALAAGKTYDSPPRDAGSYNDRPSGPSFWQGGYQGEFGEFFLDWYSNALKNHGKAVLAAARAGVSGKIHLSGKIAGIHWWYKDPTHAAEITAGYYNVNNHDAYKELAQQVFLPNQASVDFTCLEMKDSEQSGSCASGPEELVAQVVSATKSAGVGLGGENALPRYDMAAYNQILTFKSSLGAFTYLRLTNDLLQGDNFNNFKQFVSSMHSGETLLQV